VLSSIEITASFWWARDLFDRTWMQLIAVSWLVFRLTHSAFLLGVVGFTSRIPTFVFTLLRESWSIGRTGIVFWWSLKSGDDQASLLRFSFSLASFRSGTLSF